ncbi:outer membrane beta-barrel protein [Azoarcus sp. TTM-91]|uniref:XrtB/PEP-CTERM-associated polysaccharide biosynthesis outer membrane protein EpsL n=1 Tax=Azoarcus sp. TTM-91 TaxID=2691581 RepID=UPI00145D209C|nr:outer membrane beta-barrel protein [Azoarcus sp. TTM-91]
MKPSWPIFSVVPLVVAVGIDGALADEGDALNFYVSQSFRYEDNLYRLSDEAEVPRGTRHDTISTTGVGLRFDHEYSRQRLRADVGLTSSRYQEHGDLDHDSPDARFYWDWQLGNRWSGLVSHMYRESMTGFDEVRGSELNINTYVRSAATADFWWHPRWATGVGFAHTKSRFDEENSRIGDFDADTVDFNLTYRPPTENRVIFTVRETSGRYPNRPAEAGSIRDYEQHEIRLGGEWQLTGATRVSGFLGRTRLEYRFAPNRDFTGTTGRLGVDWKATAKSSVSLSIRREVGAQQDVAANYAITEAVVLAPKWALTDKMTLGAGLEWRRRDYGGDPQLQASNVVASRDADSSRRYGLSLEYKPMRALSFLLTVQRQKRNASEVLNRYDANSGALSMRFLF